MGKYKPKILIERNVPSQSFFRQLDYYLTLKIPNIIGKGIIVWDIWCRRSCCHASRLVRSRTRKSKKS